MASCVKSGFLILYFFAAQILPAQQSDSDPVLYNGKFYTYHLHPETKGNQFLKDQVFSEGWLIIRGIFYEDRYLNYDVFNQQLILKYLTFNGVLRQLAVSDAWLESFGYAGMSFEVKGPERRIFQVLGADQCRVMYKWTKTLDLSKEFGARNFVFSKPVKEMFLAISDTMFQFSGNRKFISQFRSYVDEAAGDRVRDYLRKNRINLRKADDDTVEELLSYCAGLFRQADDTMKTGGTEENRPGWKTAFSEFIKNAAARTGVHIFYKSGPPDTLEAGRIPDSIPLTRQLNMILAGTGYMAAEWNNDIVIIPGNVNITSLPDYRRLVPAADTLPGSPEQLTQTEARYLTGRSPEITQVITVGKQGGNIAGDRAKILGRILDGETGEPLMSVPVYISETKSGALTDANGFLIITLPPGNYGAEVSYLGYTARKFILRVLSDGDFTIALQKTAIRLQDVVISAMARSNMSVKKAGLDQVSVRNMKSLPVMMGEQDVLKISVTLPGIVSVGEGSAGLNVRGSGYDQNSFYINRIPVYNTSHLFGFFSSFNPDIIRDISIYKGYIPVQYGGRLASVFDITARQGNRKHITARGGISPVTGNLTFEGPLRKETGSFIMSYRSSYSDWILSKLKDTIIRSSSANFNDISGGLNMDAGKSQISFFFYSSHDRFSLAGITDYNYSNVGTSAAFSHTFGNALRSELSLSGSVYDFGTSDKLEPSSAYKYSYRLGHYGANILFKHVLNESHTLNYGLDVSLYDLDRGEVSPYDNRSLRLYLALGMERGMEASLFVSDFFRISPLISLDLGIRYGLFVPAGPANVYIYRNGVPPDQRYINDTLLFGRNEPVKMYNEPDVRASVNIRTGEWGSVKAAFNQMHQNIFMLNTGITLAPNTQWKLADYHLRPPESNLFSLGFYRTFPSETMEASAELYYKTAENYPEFREGADFLENPLVETLVLQGRQKSYGFEVYVKRGNRKLDGWISYAFSRSVIRVNGLNSWERINNGRAYPSDFDIPHSVNAVLSYHFTRRVTISSVFTYQTGKPATYPESVYYINGSPFLEYSGRNAYRIPDYMRADLSLTVEGNLRAGKPLHSSYIFNLYNATGRKNPHSVYFRSENGKIKSYMYSVIGVPIFTATWQFKLGNYASD